MIKLLGVFSLFNGVVKMYSKFKYLGLAVLLAASSITAQAECIREKGGGGEIAGTLLGAALGLDDLLDQAIEVPELLSAEEPVLISVQTLEFPL